MSLQNIKLPDIVLADLYRHSLIQYDGEIVTDTRPETVETNTVTTSPPVENKAVEPKAPEPVKKPEIIVPKAQEPEPIKQPETIQPKAQATVSYKTLGNNKQQIAIVVNFANEVFLPESDLQFLTKMLSACKLNMADVAIVNHAAVPVAIEPLKQQLQPKYVLLFGVEPGTIQLPISFPAFKEQAYAGSTYLFTPLLNELNQENEEAKLMKRKLWDCLKRMFL
jgi:hypothetical protein